jgi:hypothetical protein
MYPLRSSTRVPASGDPNRVPSKDDTSHDSFREATYGSGGMIPADGPRDPAALDSVRMNSGAPVVGTEDLIATNDVEGKGQLATTTEVSTD